MSQEISYDVVEVQDSTRKLKASRLNRPLKTSAFRLEKVDRCLPVDILMKGDTVEPMFKNLLGGEGRYIRRVPGRHLARWISQCGTVLGADGGDSILHCRRLSLAIDEVADGIEIRRFTLLIDQPEGKGQGTKRLVVEELNEHINVARITCAEVELDLLTFGDDGSIANLRRGRSEVVELLSVFSGERQWKSGKGSCLTDRA